MLDLNFVRENLETVRAALAARGSAPDVLDRFAELDAERRDVINKADNLNAQRNAASKEIGQLIQSGKKDEAEAKKAEVAGLKNEQTQLERLRDEAEAAIREILINIPNIPAADVPVGPDEAYNK